MPSTAGTNPPNHLVDAHHHLWNPASRRPDIGYIWLTDIGAPKPFGDPTEIQRDYLLDEFLSETESTNLSGSVHLQADGAIPDPVAETRFIQDISDRSGFPIAIVGFVDLTSDYAEKIILRHKESTNFRGVRQILSRIDGRADISFAPDHYLRQEMWRENFALLGDHDLSFDLQLYPEQMIEAADFLSDHPNIPVIIDHAGSPYDQSEKGIGHWREAMTALAALPHCYVKACGFGMFDRNWTTGSIRPITNTLSELFGPDRILFGSNFPVDKLMRNYREIVSDIALCFHSLGEDAATKIFGSNARRIYRF